MEDRESEETTFELMKQIKPSGLTIQPPLVIPRTDWFNRPEIYGIEFRRGREAFLQAGMRWKAKNLLPVAFWSPLPVWIGGRSFKRVLKKAGAFTRRCESAGIPTCMSDDTYLMGLRADMEPVPFRDATRQAFFTGDYETVLALVSRINPVL